MVWVIFNGKVETPTLEIIDLMNVKVMVLCVGQTEVSIWVCGKEVFRVV